MDWINAPPTSDTDPLQYWSMVGPFQLRQMAIDLLAIPAMSTEVERVFSSCKLTVTPHRNRLTSDHLEELELLRHWWRIPNTLEGDGEVGDGEVCDDSSSCAAAHHCIESLTSGSSIFTLFGETERRYLCLL